MEPIERVRLPGLLVNFIVSKFTTAPFTISHESLVMPLAHSISSPVQSPLGAIFLSDLKNKNYSSENKAASSASSENSNAPLPQSYSRVALQRRRLGNDRRTIRKKERALFKHIRGQLVSKTTKKEAQGIPGERKKRK